MKLSFKTPSDGHYFFGYYDKSPFDMSGDRLLACKATFVDREPLKDDQLEIGYFNWKKNNEFKKISSTKTWNWQQGCMLQWFGPDYNKKIIFNDIRDGKFSTVIYDIDGNNEKTYPIAYYCLSENSDFALCIDNERHYWFRDGYNYKGIENPNKNINIDYEDGIWKLDFETSNINKIISFKELFEFNQVSSMFNSVHYIEHLMINPSGSHFIFLHRWKMESGDIYTRLYSAKVDGSELRLLNDSGRMSHFCWMDNENILGWGGVSNPVNKLRKYKNLVKYFIKPLVPIYKRLSSGNANIVNLVSGDSYIIINRVTSKIKRIFTEQLKYDGHPSFLKDKKNIFVTDNYPSENNQYTQNLYLVDMSNDKVKVIDTIEHSPVFASTTCRSDLHPKVSLTGDFISVDTLENDIRAMRVYE
ncbi:hypothetical protein L2D37_07095 [Vibrio harveyi]|uniref:hypothetical protein n=1 Tax=Vibrio harveyi TaxID=669 RepID=UPI0023802D63|nr:hypothetical protein [Vibrio harveyi]